MMKSEVQKILIVIAERVASGDVSVENELRRLEAALDAVPSLYHVDAIRAAFGGAQDA